MKSAQLYFSAFLLLFTLVDCGQSGETKAISASDSFVFYYRRHPSPQSWIDSSFVSVYDKRRTRLKKYSPDGKLMSVGEMLNGRLDGSFKLYDDSGKVTLEWIYVNGEKIRETEYGQGIK